MPAGPRVTRRDLKEDKVYLTLAGVAAFFVRYRLWIALGALAVLLAFAAGYYRYMRLQRLDAEASWALYLATNQGHSSDKTAALKEVVADYDGASAARTASFELANSLYDDGHYEEALKAFQEFLKKNPGHLLAPAAMEAVGYCYESLGQWKEAIAAYETLMKKRPASPAAARANYRLGLCYENIGEKEKAVEAYKKTMELLPGSFWAEYSSERLASLSPEASAPAEALPPPVE